MKFEISRKKSVEIEWGREDRNVRSIRSNHPSPTLALPSPNTSKSPATQLVVFAPHIALVSYELICFLTFVFEWVNVTKTLRYVCRNISNTIILPFDSSDTHFSKHLSCFVLHETPGLFDRSFLLYVFFYLSFIYFS